MNLDKRHITKKELAKRLGMSRNTLHRRLKQKNITLPKGIRLISPNYAKYIEDQLNIGQGEE